MADGKPPTGVEKSNSMANLKEKKVSIADEPSAGLSKNPSQKAADLSPLNRT